MADGRFGTSALSRDRKSDALNEELIAHKEIGEISIKTPHGNVISYSSMNRFKTHCNIAEIYANDLQIEGDLSEIKPATIELPNIVADGINMVSELEASPLILKNTVITKFLLSIDMDCIEVVGLESKFTSNEPSISIDFEYILPGGTVTEFNVTRIMNAFNKTPITTPNENNIGLKLKSIKIIGNVTNVGKTMKNIIHSILVVV